MSGTAIEQIVNEYSDTLYRAAFFRLGSTSDAQDVVQEVFLSFYKSGAKLDKIENVESYLIKSLYNACNNWQKRSRSNFSPIEKAGEINLYDDFSSEIISKEKAALLHALLQKLPAEQAEIVQLKFMEDLKFHEIALLLTLPEATVKSRFRYGIDKLRAIIKSKNYYNELF